MQTLPTELPEKLKDKLLKVVCDGMDCHLEYCEEPCMKALNTVNAIHKAYYEYQIEELKKLDIVTPEEAQKRVEKIQHDFRGSCQLPSAKADGLKGVKANHEQID